MSASLGFLRSQLKNGRIPAGPRIIVPSPLPHAFFARPAECVGPELIGCLLVKRQADGGLLWGVIVETEAYSQEEPACHAFRRRTPSNETIFTEPGRFYVYVSYGMHHCVNVVTGRAGQANGVLLRAACVPGLPERAAAGPGLLARCFSLNRGHDARPSAASSGLWLAPPPSQLAALLPPAAGPEALACTSRIGIREATELPWRWYLRASRSVSRRAGGDRRPRADLLAQALAASTVEQRDRTGMVP